MDTPTPSQIMHLRAEAAQAAYAKSDDYTREIVDNFREHLMAIKGINELGSWKAVHVITTYVAEHQKG